MEDYAELVRAGVRFPPLVVFFDGKNYGSRMASTGRAESLAFPRKKPGQGVYR